MTKIIAITNQKGGVGKTAASVNLAVALAQKNRKVLLIDLDPQGNSSKRLAAHTHSKNINHALLDPKNTQAEEVIYPAMAQDGIIESLFIIPTTNDRQLAATEALLNTKKINQGQFLSRFLSRNAERIGTFDYIIIDTNPSLDILTLNAMQAANQIIIPVTQSADSHEGAMAVIETGMDLFDLDDASELNYSVLRSIIDRREPAMRRFVDQQMTPHQNKVFDTFISKDVLFMRSEALNCPVALLSQNSRASDEFNALAGEIEHG